MTAATLPSEVSSELSAPIEDKRIRVQDCTGGFTAIPHSILHLAMSKLQGARLGVFLFVWQKTVRFKKFTDTIPIAQFVDALPYTDRTIQESLRWLQRNGWISVERKSKRNSQVYGVTEELLRTSGCIQEEEPSLEKTSRLSVEKTSTIIRNSSYHKKTNNNTNVNNVTTGSSQDSDSLDNLFSNPQGVGITIATMHEMFECYKEIYSEDQIRRFCQYMNMFGVRRKTIGAWIKNHDIVHINTVLRSAENKLLSWKQSEPKKYAPMAVNMVKKALAGEVA
jgi:hypothetical protein